MSVYKLHTPFRRRVHGDCPCCERGALESRRSHGSHRFSLLLGDGMPSLHWRQGAFYVTREHTAAESGAYTGTMSRLNQGLALSPNGPDSAYKRSGLRVRTARTGCEPKGRSAQNDKKIKRKLSQTISSNIIQRDNSFPLFF